MLWRIREIAAGVDLALLAHRPHAGLLEDATHRQVAGHAHGDHRFGTDGCGVLLE